MIPASLASFHKLLRGGINTGRLTLHALDAAKVSYVVAKVESAAGSVAAHLLEMFNAAKR